MAMNQEHEMRGGARTEGGRKVESEWEGMHETSDGGAESGNGERVLSRSEVERVKALMKMLPPLHYYNKRWSVYDAELGCYVRKPEEVISRMICDCMENPTVRTVVPLRTHLSWMIHSEWPLFTAVRPGSEGEVILINCLSGVVEVRGTGEMVLGEHRSEYNFGKVLPVNFIRGVGTAEGPEWDEICPTFMKIVRNQLPDELDQEVFLLTCANAFIPYKRFEICVVALGEGGTGKTTLYEAISGVFGDCKTSLTLEEICDQKGYGLPSLWESMINIGSELDAHELNTTNWKRIVSGETFSGRVIYGAPEERRSHSKLIFLANSMPMFKAGTQAEARRIYYISFDVPVAVENRDLRIWNKLDTERDGTFMLLLKRLGKLMGMEEIPKGSVRSREREEIFQAANDPFSAFLKEYCEVGKGWWITSADSTKAITQFLIENDLTESFSVERFKKSLNRRFGFIKGKETVDGKQVRVFRGYRLKKAK